MPLRIHNLRLGFATNSSSTHSVIIMRGTPPEDDRAGGQEDSYGWECFTLSSQQEKRAYLAAQLRQGCATVDHQSQWMFPLVWGGRAKDPAFLADLERFLMRDDVVVLGGSDGGDDHHLGDAGQRVLGYLDHGTGVQVARKDSRGYWTLFDRGSGQKMRLSFDAPEDSVVVDGADAPELVDVKITDYCTRGCPYCYQGSTPQGKHARLEDIEKLAKALQKMRVFEVALGGGEPTEHPQFIEILSAFREKGIIPNFSTRNVEYLRRNTQWQSFVGGIAVSVDSAKAVVCLAPENEDALRGRVSVQVVVGSVSGDVLRGILLAAAAARCGVTLLAPKRVGRGASYAFARQAPNEWLNTVMDVVQQPAVYLRVGVDTPLAKWSQAAMTLAGVSSMLYEVQEGRFSMYVDAVNGVAGPSSYAPDQFVALPAAKYTAASVRRVFRRFQA